MEVPPFANWLEARVGVLEHPFKILSNNRYLLNVFNYLTKSSFQELSYKEKLNSIQLKLSVVDMLTSSKRKSGKNVNNTLLRVLNREEH